MAKWDKQTCTTQLTLLLTNKSIEVWDKLSPEEDLDYECLISRSAEKMQFH